MNTHDIELPPLPAGYALEVAAAMRNYARSAIEADRKRIIRSLDARFKEANAKSDISKHGYEYYVGVADAYDIAEQIVKGELDGQY